MNNVAEGKFFGDTIVVLIQSRYKLKAARSSALLLRINGVCLVSSLQNLI